MSESPARIVVSFSGGIDSTAAAVVARRTYPRARLDLLYVEMGGGEFPGFRSHVETAAAAIGGDLHVLSAVQSLTDGIDSRGWPRFLGPWCQQVLNATMGDWVRGNTCPSSTWRVIGSRRKQRAAHAGDRPPLALVGTREWRTWSPAWTLTDVDVRYLVQESGVPVWGGYALGFYRTSCGFCPGQRPYCYAALRRHYPTLYGEFNALCVAHGDPDWWYSAAVVGMTLDQVADIGEHVEPRHLSTHPASTTQQALLSWGESCHGGGGACGDAS